MPSKDELREIVRKKLDVIIRKVNSKLRGEGLDRIASTLTRLGRGKLPHWFNGLQETQSLPNRAGKTIGTIVEMLLVAVLETETFASRGTLLKISPARGVDLPDLDLGVKSPSKNFCTSEPFFSAYERLLGSEYDALVLLTDYQEAKKRPPLKLQIVQWKYLEKTQIADANLCKNAIANRAWLLEQNETWAKKIFRFLSFVNQGDWRAKKLVSLVRNLTNSEAIHGLLNEVEKDFRRQNAVRSRADKPLIPDGDLEDLKQIATVTPLHRGVIDAADDWIAETLNDVGRLPNSNEWQRYLASPLNGEIGMSFAPQWRYSFGKLFGAESVENEDSTDA